MNFVKTSLKYPQVTLSILIGFFILGAYSLFNMPRREDPKITIRTGLVIAYYPGANSEQVESQVTKKIEQYLFQFSEVRKDKTHSTSRDGAVIVNVELQEWVKNPDVFWDKLRHELLLSKSLDLPKNVVGPIVNSDFGDTEALVLGVSSDSADYSELLGDTRKIEDAIRTINAVSKIKRIGEQQQQITVSSNSEKLAQYGLNPLSVMQAIQSQNALSPTGSLKIGRKDVPLYTTGYFSTEEEIGDLIIGTSKTTGLPIHLKDVADLKREYTEPTNEAEVNGHKSLMLAIEMQEGENIVNFGKQVDSVLSKVSTQLPSYVHLTTIVNQPKIVQKNVTHFIIEFFLSILSVLIVVILLLPINIAAVAATAIPMTVAVTFAIMHIMGIELQQVSLAALIVVLGMVVDDAIVIADNYVELLDLNVNRKTAAWRCATELTIPVLTATVTIIASFIPMLIISGSVGEFISSLPLTVTIALASSFIIAMVLTPMLCYAFIHKGLKKPMDKKETTGSTNKFSLLTKMQEGYNIIILWALRNKNLTILLGVGGIILAGVLFKNIKQKFFPSAERNQFVIELWMPTGTKLQETKSALGAIESTFRQSNRIVNYATFIGTSAPRFYYNYSPEPPVTNYGQILINTRNNEDAEVLYDSLSRIENKVVPDGRVQVKLMQQGNVLVAPIEVRITGNDLKELKRLGDSIKHMLNIIPGTLDVRSDFMEDYYGITIHLKEEAHRLGFTTQSISEAIYTGFKGYPLTTMYEGNNPIAITLKLNEKSRKDLTDLNNMYLPSPVTGAFVPLRQICDIIPRWYTGRIQHRNGVRTLTILSDVKKDALASEILKKAKPGISQLNLPNGYKVSYGGEDEGQQATFSQMMIALNISLLLIFLVILLQFKELKEVFIVMITIPLSLLGAFLGLLLTHNNFGFTAFIGLISLSGIVVRNSIILIDYINDKLREGDDIRAAAIEAGQRRLRPIFLTGMAAAIGVLPMILSGSQLWSPLASVIAVGVVFSMLMSLIFVPVFFVKIIRPSDVKRILNQKQEIPEQ